MIKRLLQSFKELSLILIKVFCVCLTYTIGLMILITMAATFGVYSSLFLYWLMPFIPFELWILICLIFGIIFCVLGINEIVSYKNGYK